MLETLSTERLLLRPMEMGDFDALFKIYQDPDAARQLFDGKPVSYEQGLHWIQQTLEWNKNSELGNYTVVLKENDRILGRCGVTRLAIEKGQEQPQCFVDGQPIPEGCDHHYEYELGYAIDKKLWGCGYGTEAAIAVRNHAFKITKIPYLISVIHSTNTASVRVAIKNGFVKENQVWLFGTLRDRYVLNHKNWVDIYSKEK